MRSIRNISYLLLFFQYTILFGQNAVYSLKPNSVYDGLTYQNIYFFKDNKQGWLVGDLSKLMHTKDGGITWEVKKIPVKDKYLQGIYFAKDEQRGWITGASGTILLTNDGGRSWKSSTLVPTSNNINSIYFSENLRHGIAVGDKGTILLSSDSGITWTLKEADYPSIDLQGGFISDDGRRLWAYGSDMTFLTSIDSGNSWIDKFPSKFSAQFDNPNIYSVVFDKEKRIGYAACEYGYVLKTIDGGQNWKIKKLIKLSIYVLYILMKR